MDGFHECWSCSRSHSRKIAYDLVKIKNLSHMQSQATMKLEWEESEHFHFF